MGRTTSLYRCGSRAPTALRIQKLAGHISTYGCDRQRRVHALPAGAAQRRGRHRRAEKQIRNPPETGRVPAARPESDPRIPVGVALMSALPIAVIKIGGSLVDDLSAMQALMHSLLRLGHEPTMIHGRRVTSDLDLSVALWTMRGEVNTRLTALLQQAGMRAAGISGADAQTVLVTKRPPWTIDGREVDFGHVGDVRHISTDLIHALLTAGIVPVVSTIGIDTDGKLYNVNADTVATEISKVLSAARIMYIAESGGVRRDVSDPASHFVNFTAADLEQGVSEGWIVDGMRVKLDVAYAAVDAGIAEVYIGGPGDVASPERATRISP